MNPLVIGLEGMLGKHRLDILNGVQVGIGGAGGLGSNVAAHLVRSGFTRLLLVDFDRVEPSNLNRQFFFADQVGRFKVDALAENLLRINPEVKLTLIREFVTSENVQRIFGLCEIWVEAFDKPESKKIFVENAIQLGKRIVSASGLAGWGNSDALITKFWNSKAAIVGDGKSAVGPDCPPISPRVGVAAAKQADVVLAWALAEEG